MNMLTDRFDRAHSYLRISVTDRCNLRCAYCMPNDIAWKRNCDIMSFAEIERAAGILAAAGINKVRVTGGEPLLRRDIHILLSRLAGIQGIQTLGLTTNATLLPGRTRLLLDSGVTSLNVSLDTFKEARFERIARRAGLFGSVMRGLDEAISAGFTALKVNVVVIAGENDDEIPEFVELTRHLPITVRFIEYMPFQGNGWSKWRLLPYAEMRRRIREKFTLVPLESGSSAVSRDFVVPGFRGRVGFITSMTDSFCDSCNRLRLTADGWLKTCLFSAGELNVRGLVRCGAADDEILAAIQTAVAHKAQQHAQPEALAQNPAGAMAAIGG